MAAILFMLGCRNNNVQPSCISQGCRLNNLCKVEINVGCSVKTLKYEQSENAEFDLKIASVIILACRLLQSTSQGKLDYWALTIRI